MQQSGAEDAVRAASDWRRILDGHAAALGGRERLQQFRTFHARGWLELTGVPGQGRREVWFERPCRAREEIEIGPLRLTIGVDDGVGWMQDANGRVTLRKDPWSVREAMVSCLLQRFAYLDATAAEIELDGPLEVRDLDDRECWVLHLVESETELYLDPATLLPVGRLGRQEGLTSLTLFDDYRDVQGIQVGFSEETCVPQVGQTLRSRWETVEFDSVLPDSLFAVPQAQVRDFEFLGGRPYVDLPLLVSDGLLFLDVAVGGDGPVPFLLDSGAGKTVLDSSYAASLGLTMEAVLPSVGAGEVSRVYLITIPLLSLEGIRVAEQSGAALSLRSWASWLGGRQIRGVIGFDFLSRFVSRIDWQRAEIRLWDPDSFRVPPGAVRFDLAEDPPPGAAGGPVVVEAPLVMNVFTLPVQIDGQEATTFLLDTGAQVTVLGRELADRRDLWAREGTRTEARGVGGREQFRMVRLQSLTVAGFHVREPMAALRLREGGALQVLLDIVGGAGAGILGGNVLADFIVTLDYGNQQVIFERPSAAAAERALRGSGADGMGAE